MQEINTQEAVEQEEMAMDDFEVGLLCESFERWLTEAVKSEVAAFKEEGAVERRAFDTLVKYYKLPEHHAFQLAIAAFIGGFNEGATIAFKLTDAGG